MSLRRTRFFTSRVARRVFLLFVGAALAPLALVALLAMTQIRATLIEQGERRLAALAKAYAAAIHGRLLDASSLAAMASGPEHGAPAPPSRFDTLVRLPPEGGPLPWGDAPDGPAATPRERKRIADGRPVARVLSPGSTASVAIAVPLGHGDLAVARLRTDALFDPPEEWPRAVSFCVVDSVTLAAIDCPGPAPAPGALAALRDAPAGAARSQRWDDRGTPMRSVAWAHFLDAGFGLDEWLVVASEPESSLLAPAAAFGALFVPSIALALAAVTWVSLRLVRSTLTPLAQLTAATRQVARHDFGAQVDLARDDEFGELAVAFDTMTRQLERQFQALDALAAIDREILSSRELDRVIRPVLRHLACIAPARTVAMALLAFDGEARACLGVCREGGEVELSEAALDAEDRAALGRPPGWIDGRGPGGCLRSMMDGGVRAFYLHPVVWRDAPCAVLALGFPERTALGEEAQAQLRELAARLAVAVSSAWHDNQLYVQAHYDALTGLPNRRLLADRLGQHLARCGRDSTQLALLFIDLDHFKNVNDTQGHSHGDRVLAEAARRLLRCVRPGDTVARLGGDEFAIVMPDLRGVGEVDRVAEAALATLSAPFTPDGPSCYLGASLGAAVFPLDGADGEALLRSADTAMYRAKAQGRGRLAYFEERMNRDASERVAIDRELRAALQRGEFLLHYQPQVRVADGAVVSAEALVRWRHPVRGLLMPDRFVSIAEASGLIADIGAWVVREACRQERALRQQGIVLERLAVNASPREFDGPGYVAAVAASLREHGTPAGRLEIEVTESLLVERPDDVRRALHALKAAGVGVALDDFGVGFASIASLRDFPFDLVKIDKSFVVGLPASAEAVAIVRATIAICRALGKEVVAEGVETAEQLEVLQRLGCDYAQGYSIGRPMEAAAFVDFLQRATRTAAPAPA